MTDMRTWITRQFKATGKTKKGLAEALGVTPPAVTGILNGTRQIKADEIPAIAHYFETNVSELLTLVHRREIKDPNSEVDANLSKAESPGIRVIGTVSAGTWREVHAVDDAGYEPSIFPADPNYPVSAQFDLVVEGTSINKYAPAGYRLRCVSLVKAQIGFREGDMVIVEARRGSTVETTAKVVRRGGRGMELWPYSDDPRYQEPISISPVQDGTDDRVEVTALVLYAYRPTPRF